MPEEKKNLLGYIFDGFVGEKWFVVFWFTIEMIIVLLKGK